MKWYVTHGPEMEPRARQRYAPKQYRNQGAADQWFAGSTLGEWIIGGGAMLLLAALGGC